MCSMMYTLSGHCHWLMLVPVLIYTCWATTLEPLSSSSSSSLSFQRRCDECDLDKATFNQAKLPADNVSSSNNHQQIPDSTSNNNSSSSFSSTTLPKPPIDWNEVESNFSKLLSEDELFHKWDTMETNTKSGIRALLRSIFPKVVSLSSDAKVSGNCSAGILKWIVSLRHMKTWAVKMLDAIGKPPSGIFEGAVSMFGNYDQCLNIRVFHDDDESLDTDLYHEPHEEMKEFFRGQYCVMEFKPWLPKKPRFYGMNTLLKSPFHDEDSVFNEFSKMAVFFHFISFRMDLCVPSSCSKDDIQRIATLMANLAEFRARVIRCEVDNGESRWNVHFLVPSIILGTLLLTIILATIFHLRLMSTGGWFRMMLFNNNNNKWLKAFSLSRSWTELTTVSGRNSLASIGLGPIYTVRLYLLLWIIAVHTFIVVDFQYFREMQTLKSWASKWPTQIFTNSLFQFDCLLLVSAYCFGHRYIGFSHRALWRILLRRYLKIIALIATMICIIILLPIIIARGPLTEDFLTKQTQSCQSLDGWRNLLLIQNYFPTNCLPFTWIFCVEIQLMLALTPVLMYYRKFSQHKVLGKLFWLGLPLLSISGFVYNFAQVYTNGLPPSYYWTLPDKDQRAEYFYEYFYKPWTHLTVFVIGFYAGVYRKLSTINRKTEPIDQTVISLGTFLSLISIIIFTFGFHDWVVGELPNEYISALYNATQNLCLALAYSWILHTLTGPYLTSRMTTNGTATKSSTITALLTKLFTLPLCHFLGKLTRSAYMALPLVQTILLASQQQHLYSSFILMIYVMLGNVFFTFFIALILSLLVEIPVSFTVRILLFTGGGGCGGGGGANNDSVLQQKDTLSSVKSDTHLQVNDPVIITSESDNHNHNNHCEQSLHNNCSSSSSSSSGAGTTASFNNSFQADIELSTSNTE